MKKPKPRTIRTVSVLMILLVASVFAGSAAAQQPSDQDTDGISIQANLADHTGNNSSSTNAVEQQKHATVENLKQQRGGSDRVRAMGGLYGGGPVDISGSNTNHVKGSSIEVDTEEHGYLHNTIGSVWYNGHGSMNAYWFGANPINANQIKLKLTVGATGSNLDSVTLPDGSFEFGATNHDAVSHHTFYNDWRKTISYNGFHAQSYFALYKTYQEAKATFVFGSGVYSVSKHIQQGV